MIDEPDGTPLPPFPDGNRMPDRASWGRHAARPAPQPPHFATAPELHFSATYGPHICPACWGAGWMRSTVVIGELVACTVCGSVEHQRINRMLGRCWELSGLTATDPAALTFETCPANEPAGAAMRIKAYSFAKLPRGWLTLYGMRGGLKSGMGESITRVLLGRRIPCLFIRSQDLWEFCGAVARSGTDETDYASRRQWVTELPVLILDELGKERGTDAIAEYRHTILDARYTLATRGVGGGATVLISNEAPETWEDQALGSRAMDARFVCVRAPDVDYRKVKRP